jgi:hypothetical protein
METCTLEKVEQVMPSPSRAFASLTYRLPIFLWFLDAKEILVSTNSLSAA